MPCGLIGNRFTFSITFFFQVVIEEKITLGSQPADFLQTNWSFRFCNDGIKENVVKSFKSVSMQFLFVIVVNKVFVFVKQASII